MTVPRIERPRSSSAEARFATNPGSRMEENLGLGIGAIAGGASGAIGGPVGMLVGAALGAIIGDVAGAALHERDAAMTKRDHELDAAIGVTSGPIGMGVMADFPRPVQAATFLRADHEDLETYARSVVDAVTKGDREAVGLAVAELQSRVVAHLDGEERDLFAGFARHDPEGAAELLAEHGKIRSALAELDVAVDLHLVRADAIAALLATLAAHAARENAGLYRWAAHADDA